MVKKMAASGALNTAASPAAEPHPSKVAALAPSPLSQREILLPTVAPMVTIGPSGPALPPEPIVHVLANQCRMPSRMGKLDCSRFTASMTRVTPWPRKFVGKIQKTSAVNSAPTHGATSNSSWLSPANSSPNNSGMRSSQRIGSINPIAAVPMATPIPPATRTSHHSRSSPRRMRSRLVSERASISRGRVTRNDRFKTRLRSLVPRRVWWLWRRWST